MNIIGKSPHGVVCGEVMSHSAGVTSKNWCAAVCCCRYPQKGGGKGRWQNQLIMKVPQDGVADWLLQFTALRD